MAARLGRIVGLVAFAMVLLRLDRVLETSTESPSWALVAVSTALLGGLVTWTAATYRLSAAHMTAAHLVGMTLVLLRVSAPQTLAYGFVPGPDTLSALGRELGYAGDILQYGAPPVLAVVGLVTLVAIGTWLLGALWAWGAVSGRGWMGILPSLVFYLYLAVMDRHDTSMTWILFFALVTSAGLLSTNVVARSGTGRVRDQLHRPVPRRRAGASAVAVAVVVVGSITGATTLGREIPGTGTIQWRNPGGFGSGLGGGVSFNLFASLQQDLVSRSDQELFRAAVSQTPPGADLYWKLITLDTYNGTFWLPGDLGFRHPTDTAWGEGELAHRGPTQPVQQSIRIATLRQEYLPALTTPVGVTSPSDLVSSGLRVRADGALRVSGPSFEGLTYQVSSEVPVTDVAALASVNGELSPIFAEAASRGSYAGSPSPDQPTPPRPEQMSGYLTLPDSIDPTLGSLAREVTAAAITPFEQASLLESFFRDGDRFVYDTEVSSGHSALDLTAWLTDPDSTNYRTGYCEQFAAAMAVLGRTIGLPTRVVMGFTPGEAETQDNGTEVVVVRQRNAHAWVEVWLDAAGWVRFDPTPRGDGINRATTAEFGFDPQAVAAAVAPPPAADPRLGSPGFVDAPFDLSPEAFADLPVPSTEPITPAWVWVVSMAATAAAAIPLAKVFRRRRRMERVRAGDITPVWEELVDRLDDLGHAPLPHQTPVEFAASVDRSLVALARAYSAAIYGNRPSADASMHLTTALRSIRLGFDTRRRAMAAMNPRSLVRRMALSFRRLAPRRGRRPRPA